MAAETQAGQRPRLLLFGAGSTGRGQVAQLAYEGGWDITLVDRKPDLIHHLREAGCYTVRLFRPDGSFRDVVVDRYRVYHTSEVEAIADAVVAADLVVTSVIATNLKDVAPLLALGIRRRAERRPHDTLNVIAAENMERSSTVLRDLTREYLVGSETDALDHLVGFPDSMIARVVPVAEDPMLLLAEEYSEWTADAKAFIGRPPELMGLELVPNQEARLRRKLFIHNAGHYCCALWALAKGYSYVHEGGRDPEILAEVSATISESGAAISAEYGFPMEDIAAYRQNLLDRLACDVFVDGLSRVCREPLRKLNEHERLVGPLNLCIKHGLPYEHLARSIAMVMRTDLPGDEQYRQMHSMLMAGGPERILADVCHLGHDHPARDPILKELDSPSLSCFGRTHVTASTGHPLQQRKPTRT